MCPTPTVQYMVIKLDAQAGLIITSSHNPTEWNGLKFVDSDGLFLSKERCTEMYEEAAKHTKEQPYFVPLTDPSQFGKNIPYPDAMKNHISAVTSLEYIHPEAIRAAQISACVDTINGGGSVYVPALLRELGVNILELIDGEPTGVFAHEPEPIPANLTSLCESVKAKGADLGIAVDPDADRLVLIDETGKPLGEEYTLALSTEFLLGLEDKRGPVCKNRSTSHAIDDIAQRYSCPCFASPVGEANVAALMLRMNAVFGGEGNGGVMNPDVHIGRDSLVGLVMVLQLLSEWRTASGRYAPATAAQTESGAAAAPWLPAGTAVHNTVTVPAEKKERTISALKKTLPQYEIVKDKIPLAPETTNDEIDAMLKKAEEEWKDKATISLIDGLYIEMPDAPAGSADEGGWWVHLRRSNTERIVRIIGEAHTREKALERCAYFHRYFSLPQ